MPLPQYVSLQQLLLLAYTVNNQFLDSARSITLDAFCNSWTVVNLGNIWVNVNGMLLKGYPVGHPELVGASTGATGNYGEVYKGLVQITDARNTPGSGTTDFNLLFIQKVYVFS